MSAPSVDASTVARLRALLADVIELVQVRLELLTVEARQELARRTWMVVLAVLAVAFAGFGLIFLALFLTVLLWDSQRLLALGIFTVIFLGGSLVLALLARQRARQSARMFAATREELRRDHERLRS
ncbi:MAG: phage holin family protein [Burkholderiaceae bacterium]|jgi:uncharacterized membrane protein YqjE|nr:phage holin family protein [Burkholderiaceae bacterium]